jgi:cephalosporin hydroxylase
MEGKMINEAGLRFIKETLKKRYSHGFRWLGVPYIQFPQDMLAIQEIIWNTRPELIIETGVAHGGGLIFYASMMKLAGVKGEVVGIEKDLRPENRLTIKSHPMHKGIWVIDGISSTDETAISAARGWANGKRTMVILDSSHTRKHVFDELLNYAPLVTEGCYLIVMDTIVGYLMNSDFPDRPWGPGNSPREAVEDFLISRKDFVVDESIDERLVISCAPRGYLLKTSQEG